MKYKNQSPERNGQKVIVHKTEETITIAYITKVQILTRTNGESNTPLLGVTGLYQLAVHLKLTSELTFLLDQHSSQLKTYKDTLNIEYS